MSKQEIVTAMIVDTELEMSVVDVCQYINLPQTVFNELVQLGLFEDISIHTLRFNSARIGRLQSASRLFNDLKINAEGVVLALELLDEIEQLRQELAILQRLSDE